MERKVQLLLMATATFAVTTLARPNVERPFVPVSRGPFGKDLRDCKANWPAVSQSSQRLPDCMTKLLLALVPRLRSPQGIPELKVPSWNPWTLSVYPLGSGALTGTLFDFNVRNLTQFLNPKTTKLTYDPITKEATVVIRASEVHVDGRYEIALNLAALFDNGQQDAAATSQNSPTEGVTNGIMRNVIITSKLATRELKNGGGVAISKAEVDIDLTGAEMTFSPKTPGDPLANMLNTVANGDSAIVILKELITPLRRQLAQILGTLFNQGWRNLDKL